MKISSVLAAIHQRNPLLFRGGLFLIILAFLMFIPMMVDNRTVMGLNTWVKPIKFSLSTGIYVWTIGWIISDLPRKLFKWERRLTWVFFITMVVEMLIIVVQGARGVQSHFNINSPLDGILFGVMGLLIGLNTLAVVLVLFFYLFNKYEMDFVYLTGVRIGLLVFLIGSVVGGMIISNQGVAIGVENGGEGLPFLNWSTKGGDLRAAHFIGLHGLQIFPLFAWASGKYSRLGDRPRIILLLLFALVFSSIWSYIMINTMSGVSIVDML